MVLWGSGAPLREFLHVDDLAKAVIICADKYESVQHINVGSGHEISIENLAEKISQLVGFSGKIVWDADRPDGTPRKVLDISKITSLGWMPTIDLDAGIKNTIQWCIENGFES